MSRESSSCCGISPSREQVLREVIQIVSESCGLAPEEIRESHTLLHDVPWDSLDIVECAMEIEEHFGIAVPDDLMDSAKTVGDIADGVLTLMAQQASD